MYVLFLSRQVGPDSEGKEAKKYPAYMGTPYVVKSITDGWDF